MGKSSTWYSPSWGMALPFYIVLSLLVFDSVVYPPVYSARSTAVAASWNKEGSGYYTAAVGALADYSLYTGTYSTALDTVLYGSNMAGGVVSTYYPLGGTGLSIVA